MPYAISADRFALSPPVLGAHGERHPEIVLQGVMPGYFLALILVLVLSSPAATARCEPRR